jgi:hypothetical protein
MQIVSRQKATKFALADEDGMEIPLKVVNLEKLVLRILSARKIENVLIRFVRIPARQIFAGKMPIAE